MTATIEQARDQILTLFTDFWEGHADTVGVRATDDAVLYWNKAGDPPNTLDANGNPVPWIRVALRHFDGGESALTGSTGRKLVTRRGIIGISIFEAHKTGNVVTDKLARVAEQAFTGKTTSGGVLFRNVRTVEVGPDGVYFRTDVLADFEYDDVLN